MFHLKSAKKAGLLILSLFFLSGSFAQPAAQFSANVTEGCAPLVVSFFDQSTGNPTSWLWDLGNGSTSTQQSPSATFVIPGTYTVKLTATNAAGTNTITKTAFIKVYARPVVNFSASPLSGCEPLLVNFSHTSTPGSGSIQAVQWDFGDGLLSQQNAPGHVYNTGNYSVTLTVTNSQGCANTKVLNNYINVAPSPNSAFSVSTTSLCNLPVTATFNNNTPGGASNSYEWDFGDGSTSTDQNPTHTYTSEGNFTVTLISTSPSGCKDTLIRSSLLSIGNSATSFDMPASVCANTPVLISYSSNPAPQTVTWDFDDGNLGTGSSNYHTFTSPGTYDVTMTAFYPGGCNKTATQTIVVGSGVTSNFNSTNRFGCSVPYTVNFNNLSTGASSYLWSFGDGSTSTAANPSYTYTSMGNFDVQLIASGNGCTDTLRRNNYVRIADPVIQLGSTPYLACAPHAQEFSLNLNTSEPITSYLWTFHDGTTSTAANPTKNYAAQGAYGLTVAVVTESGCTDTLSVDSAVVIGQPFNIDFSASPLVTCAQFPVLFSNNSTGLLTNADVVFYNWDFGDGGTSTLSNPSYMYNDTGRFTIKLIINNGGCVDSLVRSSYVYITPPIAKFTFEANCGNDNNFTFNNTSIGADSLIWDFGDGNTSTEWSPTHTYDTLGFYNVTLTVYNDSTGCTRSQTQSIQAGNSAINIIAQPTEFCVGGITKLKLDSASYTFVDTIKWMLPPNITRLVDSTTYQFPAPGYYDIKVAYNTINGCWDTIVKPAFIKVHKPIANFNVAPLVQCANSNVSFNDLSVIIPGDTIVNWQWNFGDGTITDFTQPPFQNVYSDTGVYSIKLVVTDNFGCKDSITRSNYIRITDAYANFEIDSLSCASSPVQLTNLSQGANLTYFWDFGDNTSSTASSPTHTFTQEGNYDIMLAIKDQFGCRDTLMQQQAIQISNPVALFSMSDSSSTCPPLVINFTNLSQNYTSVFWDFGNGNTANVLNPDHTFFDPGNFNVKLTVQGYGNCQASYTKQVVVGGPSGTLEYDDTTGCISYPVTITVHPHQSNSNFVFDFRDGVTVSTTDTSVNHTYDVPGFYVPRVLLEDNQGCIVTLNGTDTIKVFGVKADFSVQDSLFCNAGFANFINESDGNNVGVVQTYNWDFGDGSPISHEENPTHQYLDPGQYNVTLDILTIRGCRDTVSMPTPIIIKADPQIQSISDTSSCLPFAIDLVASELVADTSAVTWSWTLPNGQTNNNQNAGTYTFSQAGTYNFSVIATNDFNCKDTVQASITIFPDPNVEAGANSFVCLGDSLQLTPSGAVSYQWQSAPAISCLNCPDPQVFPSQDQTYFVTGTDANGCKNVDSVLVEVQHPFEITVSDSATICRGAVVTLNVSGTDNYNWQANPGGATYNTATVSVTPPVTTVYTVTATDSRNCFTKIDSVKIIVYPIPEVDAGLDIGIQSGNPAVIVPIISNDVTFLSWTPTTGITAFDYPAITVMPQFTTTYTIRVSNDGGCQAQDDVTVAVLCDASNFFIPNTFTPNGDGVNDLFYPRGVGLFSIKSLRIFNRWGEVVFEKNNFHANDPSSAWDGTYKGQKLNDDVYVYYMEIICDNDYRISTKGNVALLR